MTNSSKRRSVVDVVRSVHWIRYLMALVALLSAVTALWVFNLAGRFEAGRVEYDPTKSVLAREQLTDDEVAAAGIDIAAIEQAMLAEELARLDDQVLKDIMEAAAAQARLVEESKYKNPFATNPPLPDDMFNSYLIIGADASGYLADVIILMLQPTDGGAPIMMSLPRDLYIPNACTGEFSRVNANLGGCKGVANGPTLLALTVADFTGITIDHFALVNFEGFAKVIDVLGGVELCFDHPTRDAKSKLEVEAGCIRANGATTLAWVRSRSTEQLVDDQWVAIGASDFTRQRKEQDVLFLIAHKLTSFSSLSSFQSVANSLSNSVRLDSGLSFANALALAWQYRGLGKSQVNRISLDYDNYRTPQGALVLAPIESFNAVLAEVYPTAAR
ncbi:MAG: LCP family protein [Acidimicrobiia bacterium]|nr:LCP family protein [Acidimicrobiia bacterium]